MNRSLLARRARAGLAVVACVVATSSCEDFLEVEDPSRFRDEDLDTPLGLQAVVNGVEADLLQQVDNNGWTFGQMSDELIHTGTWNPDADIDRGRSPSQLGGSGGPQSNLLQRRTAAQKAQERLLRVMGESANTSLHMARVVNVEAWANVYMGMFNCESPKAPLDSIVSSVKMFALAVPVFDRAETVAKAAGSVPQQRWAIGGRARAKLFAGDYAGALQDAQQLPSDFAYTAKFDNTYSSNTLVSFAHRSRLKAAGLDSRHFTQVNATSGDTLFIRDPYTQELDPRLKFSRLPGETGADNSTTYYNQEKFDDVADDINVVSGWEMRLIEAEVHWRQGNLAQAVTLINQVRAHAGLSPVVATDSAKVQEHLLWERFAQFYLEGMRMYDLHRFGLVRAVLGADRPTQYPLDGSEITLNPYSAGSFTGRCFPKS
jgi:hypothetical protein